MAQFKKMPSMSLTFTDSKRRFPKKIKQIIEETQQRFQAIDERLVLEHFDHFIDYDPEVFPHLAPLYWDPRVPNHPMEHFVYYEYVLRFNGHSHYYITPYNEEMSDYFLTEKDSYWERLEEINDTLLEIIHDYQIQNLAYWKDLYSEKKFQEEVETIKKRTSHMVKKPSVRALSFVDPKQRAPEFVKKTTDWMVKELQELDPHLTLTHDEAFIDFGSEEGKFLAECPYDPEEDDPDDARKGLPDLNMKFFIKTIYWLNLLLMIQDMGCIKILFVE